ncbi:hypothetical protein H4Q26_015076 [Puccinia striiformis f. sp. tritici PST-130]|nr:hypothetical protein Pst134EB_014236 [Puccinia striiformis f. sp. tritici]KAI9622792.1 hypothetical protein H4Q26_015076 [Puccinia striiformis f. sp. tritici PST-130]
MRLNHSPNGLTSLTIVATISFKIFVNALPSLGEVSEAIGVSKATNELKMSPSAEQMFKCNPGVDPASHLESSRMRFDELHTKIQGSLDRGNLIHVEDGESDDLWQNVLGIKAGLVPEMVLLHGGYWRLRERCANVMWDYFCVPSGLKKPEILPLHGNTKGSLQPFDHAEGTGLPDGTDLLDASEIEKLKEDSIDLDHADYKSKIESTRQRFRETLDKNDFTTIALKTAPAGLVDIIEEFKHKVAIIWTGPVERQPATSSWGIKYNYYQAPLEGDKLLDMGVPIIAVSTWLGNARMNAIVDKQYMSAYRALLPKGTTFLPTDDSFLGFDNLAKIPTNPKAKFSHYVFSLADGLKEKMIQRYQVLSNTFQSDAQKIQALGLGEVETQEAIQKARAEYEKKALLGIRWSTLSAQDTGGNIFREFCPVDHSVQIVTDKGMKEALGEVMEVEMKRPDRDPKNWAIDVSPKKDTNVFLVTQIYSEPLESKVQDVINWMAEGEAPLHFPAVNAKHT